MQHDAIANSIRVASRGRPPKEGGNTKQIDAQAGGKQEQERSWIARRRNSATYKERVFVSRAYRLCDSPNAVNTFNALVD